MSAVYSPQGNELKNTCLTECIQSKMNVFLCSRWELVDDPTQSYVCSCCESLSCMNRNNFESGTVILGFVVLVYCNFYAHWWLGLVSLAPVMGLQVLVSPIASVIASFSFFFSSRNMHTPSSWAFYDGWVATWCIRWVHVLANRKRSVYVEWEFLEKKTICFGNYDWESSLESEEMVHLLGSWWRGSGVCCVFRIRGVGDGALSSTVVIASCLTFSYTHQVLGPFTIVDSWPSVHVSKVCVC